MLKLVNVFSDTTIPLFEVLCTIRDYFDTVKSKQMSNILTHGFLSKCKNGFYYAADQSK